MSFILDALKKSETDRQRQSGPSLFEVKVAAPRRRLPIWAVAIAVLLGVNLIVISWMLLRHPSSQQPSATSTAAAPAVSPSPAAGAPPAGPAEGAAHRAPGPGASPSPPYSAASPPPSPAVPPAASPGPPPAADQGAPAGTPHTAGAPPAADQSASPPAAGGDPSDYAQAVEPAAGARGSGGSQGGTDGGLPLYQQIVDSAGLPSLHLDLHVFADRPRDRFVMINMHRLGEGDSLPEGVQVEAIRPDGVVLTYHGTRFLLPRN